MTAPPTPTEIAERSALTRQGWCDDSGVLMNADERRRPDFGHRCDSCKGFIPLDVTSSVCGLCDGSQKVPLTIRAHEYLTAHGPMITGEIARGLDRDRKNVGRALRTQEDVMFRLVETKPKPIWAAIPQGESDQ